MKKNGKKQEQPLTGYSCCTIFDKGVLAYHNTIPGDQESAKAQCIRQMNAINPPDSNGNREKDDVMQFLGGRPC